MNYFNYLKNEIIIIKCVKDNCVTAVWGKVYFFLYKYFLAEFAIFIRKRVCA